MKKKVKIVKKNVSVNSSVLGYNVITGTTYLPVTIKREIINEETILENCTTDLHLSTNKSKQNLNQKTPTLHRKTPVISVVKKTKQRQEKTPVVRKRVSKRFIPKNLHGIFSTVKNKKWWCILPKQLKNIGFRNFLCKRQIIINNQKVKLLCTTIN